MRRLPLFFAALALAGCSSEANHLGNPLLWPFNALGSAVDNSVYNARRGEVELLVKTNHTALLAEIAAGGGPLLTEAMELAGIPSSDRAARLVQLQADLPLYSQSPEALIVALMVYGG